jgi:hypothetical protein
MLRTCSFCDVFWQRVAGLARLTHGYLRRLCYEHKMEFKRDKSEVEMRAWKATNPDFVSPQLDPDLIRTQQKQYGPAPCLLRSLASQCSCGACL